MAIGFSALVWAALIQGLVAGYGIAIPIGPIGVIIVELGIRRGSRVAFFAGLGAASADLVYATIASLAGAYIARILAPFSVIIRTASALALIAIGVWLLYRGMRSTQPDVSNRAESMGCLNAYGTVLGLTLLNPVTVTYFTSLILGFRVTVGQSVIDVLAFIMGAFLASLSWQSFLAGVSGLAHKRLSVRMQSITFAVGNSVVILLGLIILLGFSI